MLYYDILYYVMQDKEMNLIKLLLLGPGESGKSTVLKQLRLLYGKRLTDSELLDYRRQVHDNIFDTIEAMCRICLASFPDNPICDSPEFLKIFTKDLSADGKEFPELTLDYVSAITFLWQSQPFQAIWASAFPTSYANNPNRSESTDRLVSQVAADAMADYGDFTGR